LRELDETELTKPRRPVSFEEFAVRNAAIFRGEQPPPKV
jgi:hypothetical protein